MANVTRAVTAATTSASKNSARFQRGAGLTPIHRISAGAMTMSPTASPSHHVSQTRGASVHDIVRFTALAALVSTIVSASIGVTSLAVKSDDVAYTIKD